MQKNPSIHAVIFDIGGVLIRTDDVAPRTELARRFGLDRAGIDRLVFESPQAHEAEIGQAAPDSFWAVAAEKLALGPDQLVEFRRQFWAGDRLDVGLVDWIRLLRPLRKTALLTNTWWSDPLDLFVQEYGMPREQAEASFDVVVSSAAEGLRKPDARIFQLTLDRLGVTASQAVFVDDFPRNVAAAEALGIHTVRFLDRDQTCRELGELLGLE